LNSDLIINASANEVTIALLEEKQLVELTSEKKDSSFSVGDIYLGRVRKTIPSLNAAFVDIGYEKDAFLHYLDLGPQFQSLMKFSKLITTGKQDDDMLGNFQMEPDIEKSGKISQAMSSNQWVVVQIAKEPISTKGPRISSELSLAGRYIVLVPFSDAVSISQKIKSPDERMRLKRLVQSIKPKNFGVIIRTVAEGKSVADLDTDVNNLVAKWKAMVSQLRKVKPPAKLLGELDRTSAILRDILNANFNNIYCNDHALYDEIKVYLRRIAPEHEDIVKEYKGKGPVFEHFGVDKQIKALFGKTVTMANGAYLVIEHTEALHVIDVNSGARMKSSDISQEENALQVNMDAAKEIARQLRLRDMGGIIVVDFIDLRNQGNRKELYNMMKSEMDKDRAKHSILPPSKFGLVQITRQRVRPETNIVTVEKCPTCDGTGEIQASILLIDEIENNIRYILQEQNEKSVTVGVHPFIEAYLKKGIISMQHKWFMKFKSWITIKPHKSYHFLEYHFFNAQDEMIKI
jgi:ribonuclease G